MLTERMVSMADTDSEFLSDFVYGNENYACIQALRKFADGNSGNSEPILLIGPSGTGKTHLMTALHRKKTANTHFNKVLYQTGDVLVGNILRRIWEEDKRYLSHYLNFDMLLIDDLSALHGKHSTQQEVILFLETMKKYSIPVLCTIPDGTIVTEPIVSRFPGTVLRLASPSNDTIRRLIEFKASRYNLTTLGRKVVRTAVAARGNGFLIEGALKRCAFQNVFSSTYD